MLDRNEMIDLIKDLSAVNKKHQQTPTQTFKLYVTMKKLESVYLEVEATSQQHAIELIKEGCIGRTQVGFQLDEAFVDQGSNEEYELICVQDYATHNVLF